MKTKWNPDGEEQDVKDSKILAPITEQKVKYKKETDTTNSHRVVPRGPENRGAGEGNPRTEQLQNECLE